MNKPATIEICIASVEDAAICQDGGVNRVELNAALELGGLTPSLGCLREARAAVTLPIVTMVRPRPGGFCYAESELRVMSRDVDLMLENGADGIAFGMLRDDATVDVAQCKRLMRLIGTRSEAQWQGAVFHRAFDFASNPLDALETLIDLGFRRVMTSGQRPTASEGATLIRQMIEHARGRIEVLPASGIRPHNVQALIHVTGADQVHASLRMPMKLATAGPSLGSFDDGSNQVNGTDPELVRRLVNAVRFPTTLV